MVQFKKSELNDIILENALSEFLQKGYINASLRNIAKASSTTIGNLYHYFENKEALFDALVTNEYASFLYLMDHHHEAEIPAELADFKNILMFRPLLNQFLDQLMPIFTKRFLLLLDKSGGTKYENSKEEFISILQQHFDAHIIEYQLPLTQGFGRVIAQQIICGILYIIEINDDEDHKKRLICDCFLFYIAGFLQML